MSGIKTNNFKNLDLIRQFTLVFLLIAEIVSFAILSDRFLSVSNAISVLRQVSVTGISAMGMFMVILLGDIDLSVGAMYSIIGVICAFIFKGTENAVLTVVAALVMGIAIGWFNGSITAKFKIPAFIATLATMSICRGLSYILTGGTPIGVTNPKFTFLGSGYIAERIPLPIVFMIVVVAICFIVMNHTRFGRYIYACGGNAQASKWSGINVDRVRTLVFVIAGFLNGLAAIILAGRLGGGLPATGEGSEMDVITAVVLGGTSMAGGKGKLWGVLLGVLIIGILTNGLTMVGVSTYWQKVVKGVIILAAVILDSKGSEKTV